ncbi:hypothetical protein IJT17_05940 [bacterium]|nr:hypothetical protein [bacterium]
MPDNATAHTARLSTSGRRWLTAILFLGLAVRLAAAYVQPAFLDEAFVYYVTKAGPAQAIQQLRLDVHPPTFNILMYPLASATHSIFILRLPELLLSIITLALTFFLARRFFSEPLSLALTAFTACSANLVITDAQLRTYGPLTLCLMLLWIGMLDIGRRGSPFAEWRLKPALRWGLWALAGLMGACLHILGAIALGACAVSALALPQQKQRTIGLLIAEALPVSIWFVYNRLTVELPLEARPEASVKNNLEALLVSPLDIANWDVREWYLLIQDPLARSLALQILSICALVLALLLWALFVRGWIKMRQEQPYEANLLGINAICAPVLICLAACFGLVGYTQSRYAVPFSVPFLLLVLQGVNLTSQKQILTALILPTLAISLAFPFCPMLWNQNWQGTLGYIERIKRPNDIILTNGLSESGYALAMAYDIDNIEFRFFDNFKALLIQRPTPGKLPLAILTPDMLDTSLLNDLKGYRIILVMSQMKAIPGNADIIKWLSQYYALTDEFHQPSLKNWAEVDVYVWERKSAAR